jgi:two-component sensor histidine kinase
MAAFFSFIPVLVGGGSLVYLHLTKNFKPLFWLYASSGTILSHVAMNMTMNMTHYVDFLWMVACIFLAFIGIGKRIGLLFIGINFVLTVFFFSITLNTHIINIQPRSNLIMIGELLEIAFALFILGYLAYQYIVFQDYTYNQLKLALQNQEKQTKLIQEKNEQNTLLIKEVHHRVKNNLQIITSLLRLQKQDLKPEMAEKLDEAIDRIMAMALIHRKLYQTSDLSSVNVDSYIHDLVENISKSINVSKEIKVKVETSIMPFGLKTIVPLGLILNELISNSYKHAFTNSEIGVITIQLTNTSSADFVLKYSDNGIWKESDPTKFNFGIDLIETLTSQLDGKMTREKSTYSFRLKNLDI